MSVSVSVPEELYIKAAALAASRKVSAWPGLRRRFR